MIKKNKNITALFLSLGLSGALIGAILGTLAALWFDFYFYFIEILWDSLIITLFIPLSFAILGFIFGYVLAVLVGSIIKIILRQDSLIMVSKWWYRLVFMSIIFTIYIVLFIQLQRPFEYKGMITVILFFIALALSYLLSIKSSKFVVEESPVFIKKLLATCVVMLIALAVGIGGNIFSNSKKSKKIQFPMDINSSYKVAVLGIDGITWDVIDKLFEEGRLPNLKRLVDNGVRAPLRAEVSLLNPFANSSSQGIRSLSAWTSLGTGRSYREHGLHDFLITKVPGLKKCVPFRIPLTTKIGEVEGKIFLNTTRPTSLHRRTLAIWDVISMVGLRAGIVGWWSSWPPVAINGYMITDRLLEKGLPHRWYPETVFSSDPAEFNIEDQNKVVARFADFHYIEDQEIRLKLETKERRIMERFDVLIKDLHRDTIIYNVAIELLQKEGQPDFFATYFLSPDNSEHFFWKYMDPKPFGNKVSQEYIERLGQVIPRSYDFLDVWIGKFMSLLDENTIIIICSDHGFGPWVNKVGLLGGKSFWPLNSGNHRREGVLVMSGGPIKVGYRLSKAQQIDLVPTILAVMGIPVPKDMKGEVLVEAIDASNFPHSFATIDSYEKYQSPKYLTDAADLKGVDKEYLKRLKTLGYIR